MDFLSMAFEFLIIVAIVAVVAIFVSKMMGKSEKAHSSDFESVNPDPDPSPDPRLGQEMDVPKYEENAKKPKPKKKKTTKKKAKASAKKVADSKLPPKSKLAAMKKGDLESFGKDFGIDLDKRKTKDNMIKDLQKHVKKTK